MPYSPTQNFNYPQQGGGVSGVIQQLIQSLMQRGNQPKAGGSFAGGRWNGNGMAGGNGLIAPRPVAQPTSQTAAMPAATGGVGGSNYQDDTPFGMNGYSPLSPDAVNALGTIGIQPQGGS